MIEKDFIEDLKYWRAYRPDEYTMDRFIRRAAEQAEKISTDSARIKELEAEVARVHKLGRERASDIADYRDEVKQLQDEIAELKNKPADPWMGVLNEEGEL